MKIEIDESEIKGRFIMMSEIKTIEVRIAFLKKGIDDLNYELGVVESSIDTLECYPSRGNKLDELYEQCEKIEQSKAEYCDEIVKLNKTLESIKYLEELKSKKEALEVELEKDPTSSSIFELCSVKQEISYLEDQVKKTAKNITKK